MNLVEIVHTKATMENNFRATFFLVFEFCEHDLAGLLANTNVKFSHGNIKMVMKQLLSAIFYLHVNKVR